MAPCLYRDHRLSPCPAVKPNRDKAEELLNRGRDEPDSALTTLAELYRAYIKYWSHRQIPRGLRGRVNASTVAQETMLRFQERIPDFECQSLPQFERYLLATAKNVITDLRRFHFAKKRNVLRETPLEELESRAFWQSMKSLDDAEPGEVCLASDEAAVRLSQIYSALRKLPAHYQAAIRARYEKGHSTEEIAHRIGRSPGATRMLVTRAVEALRKRVAQINGNSTHES